MHPEVLLLTEDVVIQDGAATIPLELLKQYGKKFSARADDEREKIAKDIVVLAARYEQVSSEAFCGVVDLLIALAIGLYGSEEKARAVFAEEVTNQKQAAKTTGQQTLDYEKLATDKPAVGAAGLFGVLKKNKS